MATFDKFKVKKPTTLSDRLKAIKPQTLSERFAATKPSSLTGGANAAARRDQAEADRRRQNEIADEQRRQTQRSNINQERMRKTNTQMTQAAIDVARATAKRNKPF